jgi:hypothetical protein
VTLRIIASVLVLVIAVGALTAWRPAPAVSTALVGGLAAGIAAYVVSRSNGPRGVPIDVAGAFSVGIVVGGIAGQALTRRRRPAHAWPMRRDAAWLLVVTPFAAATFLQAILTACPLYVTRDSGLCFYNVDVLGGWASAVTFLFVVDMLILAGFLMAAPGPRRGT